MASGVFFVQITAAAETRTLVLSFDLSDNKKA